MVSHDNINIKLTFLGTGTSHGVPIIGCNCEVCSSNDQKNKRLRSSVLVEINGKNIVIDAGPDFRQQMLLHKIKSLGAILITHEHADHILGLDDIRSFNWIHQKPMDVYAEKRVQKAIRRIFSYVFSDNHYPGIPQMNIHIISEQPFSIDEVQIIPIRALHHKLPVLGYRIGNMAYFTDINFIPNEEKEKLQSLDVLIINSLRKEGHISHYNLEQAIAVSEELGPSKTYLTHVSHALGKHEDVQKELPENVYLAYDGLVLEF